MGWERKRRDGKNSKALAPAAPKGVVLPFIRVVNIAVETDLGEEIESSVLDMLSSRCPLSVLAKSVNRQLEIQMWGSRQTSALEF